MKSEKSHYNIFISYRRDGGFETAHLIADRLKQAGYKVFFDVEALKSGKFDEALYNVIDQCTDFILVLSENGLERCHNEDDWLRLETLHALENKKNIIPIMLRGFEWPEKMPAGMEVLPLYNGIAADSYQHFDASVDKLKTFLKSKPGRDWERIKKYLLLSVAAVAIFAGIFLFASYRNNKILGHVCVSEVQPMGNELVKMNLALQTATDAKEEWEKYLTAFASASLRDTSYIRKQFVSSINFKLQNIPEGKTSYTLSPESSKILIRNGIKTEEVATFYSILCPSFFKEVKDYLTVVKNYARMPFVSETVTENIKLSYESLVVRSKIDYYGFLELVATMPETVINDDFYKIRRELSFLNDVPIDKTPKDYEEMQENATRELESIISKMGGNVIDDALTVDMMNEGLNQMKKSFDNTVLSEKTASVNLKKQELDLKRAEFASKQNELDEAYKRVLEKCTFTPEEDQWMMWGKTMKLATVVRNTLIIRKENERQMEINRQEAVRNGVDPSTLTEEPEMVSLDELFSELYKRIDLYIQYNKDKDHNAPIYGKAAKEYFKLLRKGEIEDKGILMVGTENDVTHPVLQTGDVIIERKGEPIFYMDDYAKLKDNPAPNVVKILRFANDGSKSVSTVTLPDSKIMMGFLNLRESKD